jgi:hypothetical protein
MMQRKTPQKRNDRRAAHAARPLRSRERGAAVFIVMLAITLLTGLGIWAARSASLVDTASGYSRQALQTQYVADLGIETTTAFLANGAADQFVTKAEREGLVCPQNQGVTNAFCYPFDPVTIHGGLATGTPPLAAPATTVAGESSLGPYAANPASEVVGDFIVEMTDKGPAGPLPGAEQDDVNSNIRQASVTLTAIATVRPKRTAAAGQCDPLAAAVAGRQTLRATAIVAPLFH